MGHCLGKLSIRYNLIDHDNKFVNEHFVNLYFIDHVHKFVNNHFIKLIFDDQHPDDQYDEYYRGFRFV